MEDTGETEERKSRKVMISCIIRGRVPSIETCLHRYPVVADKDGLGRRGMKSMDSNMNQGVLRRAWQFHEERSVSLGFVYRSVAGAVKETPLHP